MSTVLVGYRGSGKSSIGRKLADQLWQTFHDTDDAIQRGCNLTIREVFERYGEEEFRNLESAALHDALRLREHVIALGGGAILRDDNRAIIKQSGHRVIYLRCDAAELLKRIEADPATAATRPNLTNAEGLAEIEQLLTIREPLYREIAHKELDVTNLSVGEAAVRVVKLL